MVAGVGVNVRGEIVLAQLEVVHVDALIADLDRVEGKGDDAFDQQSSVGGIADDDEVSVGKGEESIGPAVEEELLAGEKSGFHAGTAHSDGTEEEIADEQEADDGPEGHAKEYVPLTRLAFHAPAQRRQQVRGLNPNVRTR